MADSIYKRTVKEEDFAVQVALTEYRLNMVDHSYLDTTLITGDRIGQ